MKANMGSTDKIIRILAAVIIAGLYFTDLISGSTATILLIIAGVFILTSVISICPMYIPFGISTKAKAK